jgi:hypothetical protein
MRLKSLRIKRIEDFPRSYLIELMVSLRAPKSKTKIIRFKKSVDKDLDRED